MSISEKQLLGDFFIFKQLNTDSVGRNFRAGEVKDNTILNHKLLTEVHPFLSKQPGEWERVNSMVEDLKKAGIPHLFLPEKIIGKEENPQLISPLMKGKTLDQIITDSTRNNIPITFNLAFSIALAIAEVIEAGSSLVVNEEKSFHGFLTPEHIFVDYEGQIFLKHFRVWPFFEENDAAVSKMIELYGPWLAPEFIRKEKIVHQSDFFYLGFILYRMITGNYFNYLPGEDFESTFTSISSQTDLPSTDIPFLTTFINFFKKTLNPDVTKRFSSIDALKHYILTYLYHRKPSASKAGWADHMNLLYSGTMGVEEKELEKELSRTSLEKKELYHLEINDMETEFVNEMPVAMGEAKRSKRPMVLLIILIAVITFGGILIINQMNKVKENREIATNLLEEREREKEEYNKKLSEVTKKVKTLEEQIAGNRENETPLPANKTSESNDVDTVEKKNTKTEAMETRVKEKKPAQQNTGPIPTKNRAQTGTQIKETQIKETNPSASTQGRGSDSSIPGTMGGSKDTGVRGNEKKQTTVKKEPPREKEVRNTNTKAKDSKNSKPPEVVVVPLVPLNAVTVKPKKVSGRALAFPAALRKSYAGRRARVQTKVLIDEHGTVTEVEVLTKLPGDVKAVIIDTLKKWKYTPAQRNNDKVKVWLPVKIKIDLSQSIAPG
ncbi:MAG: protein kinase [bacterium]|nr:protein kinase [bacterium]